MQITKDSTSDMLSKLDASKYDAAVGPIRLLSQILVIKVSLEVAFCLLPWES